jgi:hypothetical protein
VRKKIFRLFFPTRTRLFYLWLISHVGTY